ncbi:MAG TPA: DUF4340 domain-containing protein, partial [Planctomycetota bacterium]|nr:DUF4340 domain-containing protein [Planctomycetota bacterium]
MIGRNGLLALVGLTVVVGLAAWGLRERSRPSAAELPERFVPELSERLNELTALTVQGQSGSFTIRRAGETWGLDEKDGHPVRFDKLKTLLVGLSELRPLERKTASPALHAKLGLQVPGPEAASVRLTVLGADGAPVADLIAGNPGPAPRTRYVRRSDEDQSWLVQGDLNPDDSLNLWVDTEVMRLDPNTVSKVTVTHPDGEVLVVDKQAKDDPVWTVQGVPEGFEPKSAGVTSRLTAALQWLDFDDVAAASRQPLPESDRATSVFETWDGLRVTVTSAREPPPAAEATGEPAAAPPETRGGEEGAAATPPAPEASNWIAI